MILVSYFFRAFGIVDVAKKPVSFKLNKMGFFLILQIGNINKIYLFSHLCYLFYKNVILSFTSAEMLKNSCKVVHDPFSNLFFFVMVWINRIKRINWCTVFLLYLLLNFWWFFGNDLIKDFKFFDFFFSKWNLCLFVCLSCFLFFRMMCTNLCICVTI